MKARISVDKKQGIAQIAIGNGYEIKETLKEMGYTYNGSLEEWYGPEYDITDKAGYVKLYSEWAGLRDLDIEPTGQLAKIEEVWEEQIEPMLS